MNTNKKPLEIEIEKMREEAVAAGKKLSEASAKVAAETMSQAAEALESFGKELRDFGVRLDRWVEKHKTTEEAPKPETTVEVKPEEKKDPKREL